MMHLFRTSLMAIVLATAFLTGHAPAQTGPIGSPSTTQPGLLPGASLSEQDLEAALRAKDPGLKVSNRYKEDGTFLFTSYGLSVRVGDTTHRVIVWSIPRENKIVIFVPLTARLKTVPDGIKREVDLFNGLPSSSFQFDFKKHQDGTQTLLAALGIPRPATAQAFQKQLDQLLQNVQTTRYIWDAFRPLAIVGGQAPIPVPSTGSGTGPIRLPM